MKKYIVYYYLLFVLLIFGAFASMAQNDYGIKILGAVSLVFALLFLSQLISVINSDREVNRLAVVELTSLIVLSFILSLRVFYIHFQFVEILFALAGILLIGVYLAKLVRSWNSIHQKNSVLSISVSVFYASIISYVASMTLVPFVPTLAEPAGILGFILIIGFIVLALTKKQFMIDGEKVSAFRFVYRIKDRSPVLIVLFLLFTAYMGLTKIEILPKMYSDEFPQVYFEMVNDAEMGKEEPIDGKYKHERFKEKYDEFVSRQSGSDKK